MGNKPLYAVYSRPAGFISRSGLLPLVEAVEAISIPHGQAWHRAASLHWRLGIWMRYWGIRYYGSAWNELVPWWDEYLLARRMNQGPGVAHFLFAEFAGPRRSVPFRKRGHLVAGTFHASPRRQASVTDGIRLDVYDGISVVARKQLDYFVRRGYPAHRLFLTRHGVDVDYFHPLSGRGTPKSEIPIQALLVGSTERDHEFAAEVMRTLPSGLVELSVATTPYPHPAYRDVFGVRLLPHLDDDAMRLAYQWADILFMPLLDATANNAILESMACGTPVVTNRTSGTADYVNEHSNYVLGDREVTTWVRFFKSLADQRDALWDNRAKVRAWAESFSWATVVSDYQLFYESIRGN